MKDSDTKYKLISINKIRLIIEKDEERRYNDHDEEMLTLKGMKIYLRAKITFIFNGLENILTINVMYIADEIFDLPWKTFGENNGGKTILMTKPYWESDVKDFCRKIFMEEKDV